MERIVLPQDFSAEERGRRAEELFVSGYNCCQAVALAFADIIEGAPEQTLKIITAGFGGGFGRLREVCGAVSGMTVLAGFIRPAADPGEKEAKTANYALVQDFAGKFKEQRGSIICRELLDLRMAHKAESPEPSDRTPEYYKTRPCTVNVGVAARIVANTLLEEAGRK